MASPSGTTMESVFEHGSTSKFASAASSKPTQYSDNELLLHFIDQEELDDPTLQADPDSCFSEFEGVLTHHKICHPESLEDENLPEDGNQTQISDNSNRVGTGLGSDSGLPIIRMHGLGASVFTWNIVVKPLARLTVLSSLFFVDFLVAEKAILIGYSAGSLVAVDAYFQAPERVAAMIFVAPAIYTLLMPQILARKCEES